jgi:hypothetical protein
MSRENRGRGRQISAAARRSQQRSAAVLGLQVDGSMTAYDKQSRPASHLFAGTLAEPPRLAPSPAGVAQFPGATPAATRDLGYAQHWADGAIGRGGTATAEVGKPSVQANIVSVKPDGKTCELRLDKGKRHGVGDELDCQVFVGNGDERSCGVDWFTSMSVYVNDDHTIATFERSAEELGKHKVARIVMVGFDNTPQLGSVLDRC